MLVVTFARFKGATLAVVSGECGRFTRDVAGLVGEIGICRVCLLEKGCLLLVAIMVDHQNSGGEQERDENHWSNTNVTNACLALIT